MIESHHITSQVASLPDESHVNDAESQERHSNDERSVGEPRFRAEASHAELLYGEGEVGDKEANEDGVPGHQDHQDPGQVGNVEHLFFI